MHKIVLGAESEAQLRKIAQDLADKGGVLRSRCLQQSIFKSISNLQKTQVLILAYSFIFFVDKEEQPVLSTEAE